jgi:diguanylate cyclase (GGDEF)-like protein
MESVNREIIPELAEKDVAILDVRNSIKDAISPILNSSTSIGVFLEDGKPMALITERDIIKNLVNSSSENELAFTHAAKKLITLNSNRSIEYALFLMSENNIKRLIVVDDKGLFVGVLTQDIITSYLNKRLNSDKLRAINFIRGRELLVAKESATLMDIARLFYEHKIGMMPIVDKDGCMVGVLTDTDMLNFAEEGVDFKDSANKHMSAPVITVSEFATVEEILNIFEHYKLHHVVVASNTCSPTGVISKRDIIRNMNDGYYRMLEKKARNFKSAINTLTFPALEVFNHKDEFIIEWYNKKAEDVFGSSLFDKHLAELLDSKSMKLIKEELKNPHYQEIVYSYKEYVFDIRVARLNDNAVSLIFNDITKYHNSKQFIQSLFDLLPQIITVSTGRKLAYCNNSMLEFFGFASIDEFLENHNCICDFFADEIGYLGAGEEGAWIHESYENTKSGIETKVKMPSKDDEIRVFRLETKRFPDMDGLFVSSFFDITEAELYTQMMDSQNQVLEGMVESRTSELKMSKVLLEKAQKISKLTNCIYDIKKDDMHCYGDMADILGVPEPPKSFSEFLEFFDDESQKALSLSMAKILHKQEGFSLTLKGVDGNGKVFFINAEPYEIYNKEVIKVFGTFQDISEQVELKRLANYDNLTNIYNRNKIDDILKNSLDMLNQNEQSVSVILFDVDHFKGINDRFGHQEGDRVLSELALFVKSRIRGSDIFARWGGEEFLIVAVGLDLAKAEALSEKLREAIEGAQICTKRALTCSFGVAEVGESEKFEKAIKRADEALYEAKGNGRNRVCISRNEG